jgi:hypothetical protein
VLHFPIFCRLFSAKVLEMTLAQECNMNSRVESSFSEHFEKVMRYTKPSTQKQNSNLSAAKLASFKMF